MLELKQDKQVKNYTIWTDGSAETKQKRGGIGVFIKSDTGYKTISKGFQPTKIGRMEITALLYAIRYIPKNIKTNVVIYSDSQYVVNSLTKGWIVRWQQEGWVGRKNTDLWKLVLAEIVERPKMKLRLRWTKGHSTPDNEISKGNSYADILANYKNFDKFDKDLNDYGT